jgi:hypothetical protein
MRRLLGVGIAALLVFAVGTVRVPADAAMVGVGYAEVNGVTWPPIPDPTGQYEASVGQVFVNNGVIGNGFLKVANLWTGTFHGHDVTYECCYPAGAVMGFDDMPVSVWGTTVDHLPVSGTCHGGYLNAGPAKLDVALHTTCEATVGARSTGPFGLNVLAPVMVRPMRDYSGVMCVLDDDQVVQSACSQFVGTLDDPGLGP